jgi:hypothetical protein
LLTVGEPDFYAVLHASGSKIVAAEEVPQGDIVYDPQGFSINSSISWGFFADNNMTVTVTNQSGQTLTKPFVLISVPGSSGNYTDKNGVAWMFTLDAPSTTLEFAPCMVDGRPINLTSGASCSVTFGPLITTPFGSPFRYSVEVRGRLGSHYSVTKETFTYSLSTQESGRLWVRSFIKLVNSGRNGSTLSESPTLDKFAALRFNTAVTQPGISDYGLYGDEASFFGANTTPPIVEILLYPTIYSDNPYSYASFVQSSGPGHWAALTDKNFTHYGYYVGTGPYEVVREPCPVYEIPRAGINITQFFESYGCSVSLEQATWLVIILPK